MTARAGERESGSVGDLDLTSATQLRDRGASVVPGGRSTVVGRREAGVPPGRESPVSRSPALPLSRSARRLLGVLAALALAACRATPGEAPVGRERLGAEPRVRVGVAVDTSSVALSANAPFEVTGPGGEVVARGQPGTAWTIVAASDGRLSGSGAAGGFGPLAGPLAVRVTGSGAGRLTLNGRPYRGSVLLRSDRAGAVSAVNLLEMEEYLKGVVPFEIGRRTPAEVEAVKSQAVAARTYAVGRMGKGPAAFDFYATVQDQVYGGVSGEDSVATRAVEETRGEIVTYQGQPIQAYYSSTCGGQTAETHESWPWRAPAPYLQSVSDRIPGTDRAYCDISPRYRWTATWTMDQLKRVLRNGLSTLTRGRTDDVRRVEDVRILGHTPSGRVDSLRIRVDGHDYTVRADSIRWVLRLPSGAGLNSSMLMDAKLHAAGDSIALEVHGGGYGHGIGMCQFGAIGRARAGQSYRQILGAYYQDTKVTRLY